MPEAFEPLIPAERAAELLSVSRWLICDLARRGELPAHKIGVYWRFRPSELEAWLKGKRNGEAEATVSSRKPF